MNVIMHAPSEYRNVSMSVYWSKNHIFLFIKKLAIDTTNITSMTYYFVCVNIDIVLLPSYSMTTRR